MMFFELFSNAPEIIDIPAGQPLFNQGDHGSTMYVLLRGQAEIVIGNHLMEVLEPGNIVGEMSIVAPGPRSATVRASEESRPPMITQARPFFHSAVEPVARAKASSPRMPSSTLRAK